MGCSSGPRYLSLRHSRHRHRGWCYGQWAPALRPLASGDGAHPHSPRLAGGSISWSMSVSWRLSGGAGLRSSPGSRGSKLGAHPADHAWPLVARYLALGLVAFICTLVPQRIMGGGIPSGACIPVYDTSTTVAQQLPTSFELHTQLDDTLPPALGTGLVCSAPAGAHRSVQ